MYPGHTVPFDPLYKLRPFLQPLLTNFQHHYTLHREVSVDETMIGFKGRLGFLQYMPKKDYEMGTESLCVVGCTQWLYIQLEFVHR